MKAHPRRPVLSAAAKDLILILIIALVVFLLSSMLNIFERFTSWALDHDELSIDEFTVVLLVLTVGGGAFAWRRWRELKTEHARRLTAESSIKAGDEAYKQIVEQAEEMIYRCDSAGRFIFCNPSLAKTLGYSESELLGRRCLDVITPDQRQVVAEFYGRQFSERQPNTYFEFQALTKNGAEVLIGQTVQLLSENGRIVGYQSVAQNLTSRKKAEESQRQIEEYRNLFKLANDPILIFDREAGTVLDVNDKATETYGIAREDFIGLTLKAISDDPDAAGKRFESLCTTGRIEEFETTHLRADGSQLHVMINPSLIEYQGHHAVLSINRDVTQRKQHEREQQRLQAERDQLLEQLQIQIEVMPVAFVLTDPTFHTTYWNPAAERIFGYTKEEILGKRGHQLLVPADSQPYVEAIFEQVAAGESRSSSFSENVTKEGRRITCEWYTAPLRKADGTFLGVMSMAQDVTERKETDQALKEANQRAIIEYQKLLERLAALAQSFGAARSLTTIYRALHTFAITSTSCNGMFVSLYDVNRQERTAAYACTSGEELDIATLPQMPMSKSPQSRAIMSGELIIENDFQGAIAGQPLKNVGLDVDPKLPQSSLVAPMLIMDRVLGAVEIQSSEPAAFKPEHAIAMQMAANLAATAIENVNLMESEQVKEEQLRQSQKMEAVGHLAGGIAHDFNNLLTAINGYSDLALRRLSADSPLRKNLEEIKKAGLRAASLTSQLLAFSRKQVLQPKVLDLNEVVSDLDKMLRRVIGEDIDLVTLPTPNLGRVKADPGQVEQLILNLVVNARDAMPRGGKITIETNHTYLDGRYAAEHLSVSPGHYVRLSVSDTGAGMDKATQKMIFEPFFTTKEVGKGTGLGLSTVYGIVKQSGGNIWVYSEIGKGSTFKIYLPRVDDVSLGPQAQAAVEAPGGSETVLLVEDEETVRDLSRSILEDRGYRVIVARNGVEGLRICNEFAGKIDLMITDVIMPEMSGRELAEHFCQARPATKVLYMSGYTDDAIVRHGILEEHVSFIQKPFLPDSLALRARKILDDVQAA